MPTDRRRRKLAQLKGLAPLERGLLANARCLSEGVDVPSLDGVAFIDPRSSQIDIIQAVGRAIRLSPNKKAGTIVVPVFIEDGDSAEESIEASNFKPVWDVLNALKAHDDVLSAEMDQIRTEMGRKVGSLVGAFSKIQIDLPLSVGHSFGESLRTHLVEKVTAAWEFWFGLLQNYVAEHGDCLVPASHKLADGYALGNWVASQRAFRALLSEERKARLEGLPGWAWSAIDEQWETAYRHLKGYAAENGNCMVSPSLILANGYELGQWVKRRRADRKKMSSERRMMLEMLPGWSWTPHKDKWEEGFRYLEVYSIEVGDCLVERDFTLPDGYSLGQWVSNQRAKRAKLFPERRSRLESLIGWSWNPHSEKWETGFQHLAEYSEREGHCLVPSNLELADGYPLGRWLVNQRVSKSDLSSARRSILESLKGWSWTPLRDKWEEGYRYLQKYSVREGNCLVPVKFTLPNGFGLGRWVNRQRSDREMLSDDRKKYLEAIVGWTWNARDEQWEMAYRHLEEYAAKHGSSMVSPTLRLANGYRLGQWVSNQRAKRVQLNPEFMSRLESLKGWSWTPHKDKWEKGYRYLQEYSVREGNCLVPAKFTLPNGFRLGHWVSEQRGEREMLADDRREYLEAIVGWTWNARDEQWDRGFAYLNEYFVKHNHCLVPPKHTMSDGFQLGSWVTRQRSNRAMLSPARKKKLESLNSWTWEPHQAKWLDGLQHLRTFADQFGHSLVRADFIANDGFKLGLWVTRQRAVHPQLAATRIAQLEEVPGWQWRAAGRQNGTKSGD